MAVRKRGAGDNLPVVTDARFWRLVATYQAAKAEQAEHDAIAAAAKERAGGILDQVLGYMGDAPAVKHGKSIVEVAMVGGRAGTLVTPEMVGTRVGARAPYPKLIVRAA